MKNTDLRGCLLAALTSGAATMLSRFTWPLFAGAPFAPLFGAVAASTQWGTWPGGLLAIALCSIGARFAFPHGWNPASLVVFIPVSVFATYVITSRNRAVRSLRANEAALRETVAAQRQAALDLQVSEKKLRHAQKMEAIGRLVAGVAHNFNNLLTVTMGYTELLLDRHPRGDVDRADLEEIRKATSRGASLTRQLIALGHKHDARRERVDLKRAVADLRQMLRRVIREDIALTIDLPASAAAFVGDQHDLEQVILNLVFNARDALPSGGAIHIEVARETIDAANSPKDVSAQPGEYVRLRVTDDGTGMTPEAQSHLFEPFFTTKEVGEGTGLGLPFVHGIARQTGGFVTIDTAPGRGTSVSVYFPQAGETEPEAPLEPPGPSVAATDRGITVLLVEDETIVRNLAARALTHAGYHVLSAGTPSEAWTLFTARPDIALLLTDVVMPEMHGPALARRLGAVRPDLPVLFMSGYSDSIPADAAGTERAAFLAKPFAPADLVAAVADLVSPDDRAAR